MLDEQGAGHLIAPKERPKQLPLLNYRSPTKTIKAPRWGRDLQDFPQVEMTSKDYQRIYSEQRGTLTVDRSHRVRFGLVEMRDGKPARFADHSIGVWSAVFLTDSKAHPVPGPASGPTDAAKLEAIAAARRRFPERVPGVDCVAMPPRESKADGAKFEALKQSLKTGIKVVAAPQLFPTPPQLAARMVELADIHAGNRVLEPSFGTGALLEPVHAAVPCVVVGVEINRSLCDAMRQRITSWTNPRIDLVNADFLQCNGDLGTFDRVVMNPPFANGIDIVHVRHALNKLKPGGRVVAIVSAGPRQHAALQPLAEHWEELPDGTFAAQGTGVRTVLATFNA